MEDYQLRVTEELRLLAEMTLNLYNFINFSDAFMDLVEEDQKDLAEQLQYMLGYQSVLAKRVSRFK